jgi:hypothetical protein
VSARFVLIHSLAHSLINQWSLDSGYPAAISARAALCISERSGILIYTASSDSAGSLGGIVAQAQVERLHARSSRLSSVLNGAHLIRCASRRRRQWCRLPKRSGMSGCLLLPEVSCEERKIFWIERSSSDGEGDSDSKQVLGFFADLEAMSAL